MQAWKPSPFVLLALMGVAGIGVFACGGGGGGGGGGGTPSCSDAIPRVVLATPAQQRSKYGPNVIVPESSIVRAEDARLRAHTNFLIRMPSSAASTRAPDPSGFTPAQILKAYNLPTNGGSGAIAIVDAYNWPTALHDFNAFANEFGLPQETSSDVTSSSNTVFQVVYANGIKPGDNNSWSQEMALDTEWAHAIAPNAKIYLVEASSSSPAALAAAIKIAKVLPGVKQVSLSFGIAEDPCDFVLYDPALVQSGVTFFAASGDDAGQRDFPGESKNVVAVGGTALVLNVDNTWKSESVWDGTTCGPSSFEPRPSFQDVVASFVGSHRANCDIAAVGDPNTGVNVYDSFASGLNPWQVFGGTSVSCPVIAAIANVAGVNHSSSAKQNEAIYAGIGSANFHDIVSGSANGFDAKTGYDFPSGVGTPNGVAGF